MSTTGSECVLAAVGGSGCAGFTTSFPQNFGNANASSPSSYPSVVYGWTSGSFYGGYRTPKTVSSITSATTSWSRTTPINTGTWDASYDIWFAPTTSPANANGGAELMIWQDYSGNKNPVGSKVATLTNFGTTGASWDVWVDTSHQQLQWNYIAYRRTAGSGADITNMDLKQFFTDAVGRSVVNGGWYLLGVQSGFEIWQQNAGQTMTTKSFAAAVN